MPWSAAEEEEEDLLDKAWGLEPNVAAIVSGGSE
jgi:hypothetical protein